MDIILEQYRTRLVSVRKRAPGTVLNFDKAAKRFQQYLDIVGKPMSTMTSWDMEDYLGSMELAPNTVRTHWIHLAGAYREAHRRGQMTKDITRDVYLAPAEGNVRKTIPYDDLRAMQGRLQIDRQWCEYHLLAYTGMRMGEIRTLRWRDIDLAKGTIYLGRTKNGDDRHVPLHPTLLDVLLEDRGDPDHYVVTTIGTSPVAYDTWIADLREFAPGYTAHWFRRTVTQSLLENEVEPHVVKWILGWAPQDVMGRFYSRANIKLMQRAILKLYADDPI